jgi:hypothetical protein
MQKEDGIVAINKAIDKVKEEIVKRKGELVVKVQVNYQIHYCIPDLTLYSLALFTNVMKRSLVLYWKSFAKKMKKFQATKTRKVMKIDGGYIILLQHD